MARLEYLNRDDLPEDARRVFDDVGAARGYVPNLYRALAHSPRLMGDFVRMGATIRRESALPADLKELAILTVARVTAASTMWVSHLPLGRAAGLDEDQLVGLPVWRRHTAYSAAQRAVMAYAEEVTETIRASDATWADLKAALSSEQLAELALIVGFYNMVARFLEPVQVDLDPRYL
ncbi:MAG: carboxymuconolactone decarboxylase family protein [Tepidiformaceae bacterium]